MGVFRQTEKSENFVLGFFICAAGTTSFAWHTQHHLPVRATSLPLAAQMNEVEAVPQMMLRQVANDVGFAVNDVALRANGMKSLSYFSTLKFFEIL